jgi:hypothetical protein
MAGETLRCLVLAKNESRARKSLREFGANNEAEMREIIVNTKLDTLLDATSNY